MTNLYHFCNDCGEVFTHEQVTENDEVGNCLECFGSLTEITPDGFNETMSHVREDILEAAEDSFQDFKRIIKQKLNQLEQTNRQTIEKETE